MTTFHHYIRALTTETLRAAAGLLNFEHKCQCSIASLNNKDVAELKPLASHLHFTSGYYYSYYCVEPHREYKIHRASTSYGITCYVI